MRNFFFTALFIILAIGMPGCAAPPPRAPSPSPLPVPATVEILFEVSGGVGGQYAKWTIYGDGQISRQGRFDSEQYVTAPEDVRRLLDNLYAAGFLDLQTAYANVMCADCFNYVIAVRDGQRSHRVYAVDAGQLPAEMRHVIQILRTFVNAF